MKPDPKVGLMGPVRARYSRNESLSYGLEKVWCCPWDGGQVKADRYVCYVKGSCLRGFKVTGHRGRVETSKLRDIGVIYCRNQGPLKCGAMSMASLSCPFPPTGER
jgi:hypothetical protein